MEGIPDNFKDLPPSEQDRILNERLIKSDLAKADESTKAIAAEPSGGSVGAGGIFGKRQFSLSHLFLEMFWVAAALGMFRAMSFAANDGLSLALMFGGIALTGAAIGGVFGNMLVGAIAAAVVAVMIITLVR